MGGGRGEGEVLPGGRPTHNPHPLKERRGLLRVKGISLEKSPGIAPGPQVLLDPVLVLKESLFDGGSLKKKAGENRFAHRDGADGSKGGAKEQTCQGPQGGAPRHHHGQPFPSLAKLKHGGQGGEKRDVGRELNEKKRGLQGDPANGPTGGGCALVASPDDGVGGGQEVERRKETEKR